VNALVYVGKEILVLLSYNGFTDINCVKHVDFPTFILLKKPNFGG